MAKTPVSGSYKVSFSPDLSAFKGIGSDIKQSLEKATANIPADFAKLVNGLADSFKKINEQLDAKAAANEEEFRKAGEDAGEALGEGVVDSAADEVAKGSKTISQKMGDALADGLVKASSKIGQSSKQLFAGIKTDGITASFKNLGSQVLNSTKGLGSNLVTNITSGLKALPDRLRSAAATGASNMRDGLLNGIRNLPGNVAGIAAKIGSNISSGVLNGIKGLSSRISSTITDGLGAAGRVAGTAVAATLGTSLVKGWGRLTSIDTAETKLKALGNSTEDVAKLMSKALDSVSGTSFGLGDAAGALASLSAAKVPMEKLDASMSSMVATAALAGAPLSEMSDIFSQAAASGKIDGGTIDRLVSRQVPALSMIAEYYGTTAEEAKKMVSDGKVSFDDFVAIMGKNGDAAKIMGTSMQGLLDNTGAAMGRFGAVLQKPFFEAIKIALPGVIALFDQLSKAFKPIAEALAPILAGVAERFATAMSNINLTGVLGSFESFTSVLGPLLPVILGVAGAFGGMLSSLPLIGPLFAGITGPVGLLAGGLIALLAFDPAQLTAGFDKIAEALPGMIEKLVGAVTNLVPKLVATISTNLPVLVNGVLQIVQAVIPALLQLIPVLIEGIVGMIPTLVMTLAEMLPQIVTTLVQALITIATLLAEQLPNIITTLVTALVTLLPVVINGAIQLFLGILEALPIVIVEIVKILPSLITQLIDAIVSALPLLIEGALKLFGGLATALPQVIIELVKALPQILGSLISGLVRAGGAVVEGIWKGIQSAFPQLLKGVGDLLTGLWKEFLNFFGIHSPSRLMRDTVGKQIGLGVGVGIEESIASVLGSVDTFDAEVAARFQTDATALLMASDIGTDSGSSNGDITVIQNFETRRPKSLSEVSREARKGVKSGIRQLQMD